MHIEKRAYILNEELLLGAAFEVGSEVYTVCVTVVLPVPTAVPGAVVVAATLAGFLSAVYPLARQ